MMNNNCSLCGSSENLSEYANPVRFNISVCGTCLAKLENPESSDSEYWAEKLPAVMWTDEEAVQIQLYRICQGFSGVTWADEMKEQVYLEEKIIELAQKHPLSVQQSGENANDLHKDSNGTVLQNGDSVTLIKDLDVKGANFTAKRGTVVKNIQLVDNNTEHIEGKVNSQQIVILTKFVKKSN